MTEDNTPYCPECGSENITAKQPYNEHNGVWKCGSCGYECSEPIYGSAVLEMNNSVESLRTELKEAKADAREFEELLCRILGIDIDEGDVQDAIVEHIETLIRK